MCVCVCVHTPVHMDIHDTYHASERQQGDSERGEGQQEEDTIVCFVATYSTEGTVARTSRQACRCNACTYMHMHCMHMHAHAIHAHKKNIPTCPPTRTRSPSEALPAMPLCAATKQLRPTTALWATCTWLSSFVCAPIHVCVYACLRVCVCV